MTPPPVETPIATTKTCALNVLKTEVQAVLPTLTVHGFTWTASPTNQLILVADRALTNKELAAFQAVVDAHVLPTPPPSLVVQYAALTTDSARLAFLAAQLGLL